MSQEVQTELERLRERNAELEKQVAGHEADKQSAVTTTLEAMKKSSHIEIAKVHVQIENFPDVDRTKPRWYGIGWQRVEGGEDVPLNGMIDLKIRGGGSRISETVKIRMINGLHVTNDQRIAHNMAADIRFTGVNPV